MFIFYALFYLSDSLNNKHVSFTLFCFTNGSLFDSTAAVHLAAGLKLLIISHDPYQQVESPFKPAQDKTPSADKDCLIQSKAPGTATKWTLR